MVTHEMEMAQYARRIVRLSMAHRQRPSQPWPQTWRAARRSRGGGAMMLLNSCCWRCARYGRNLMRSFLTMLGIVIGVSAVITMVTLGNGATLSVQAQIASLGAICCRCARASAWAGGGHGGAPAFKDVDADAIAQQIGGVRRRARGAQQRHRRRGRAQLDHQRAGSTNAWLQTGSWTLARPRVHADELRVGAAVCLIGQTVQRELFGASTDPLGDACACASSPARWWACWPPGAGGVWQRPGRPVVLLPLKTLQRRVIGSTRVPRCWCR